MAFVATTITEHIRHEGKIEGKIEGKVEGKIELIENFYLQGILSKDQYEAMVTPLRRELVRIMSGEK